MKKFNFRIIHDYLTKFQAVVNSVNLDDVSSKEEIKSPEKKKEEKP